MPTKDWLALVVSVISLALSAYVLYYTEFRGPHVLVAIGHDVLITKTTAIGPRIGVTCSFANDGARQTILTNASLQLDSPQVTLPLSMVSKSFGEWTESGGQFTSLPVSYSLAVPIPIKAHDEAAVAFWFVPSSPFELTAGRHRLLLAVSSQDGTWQRHFDLDLAPSDLSNMAKSPYSEHAITVVDQN